MCANATDSFSLDNRCVGELQTEDGCRPEKKLALMFAGLWVTGASRWSYQCLL